MDCTCFFLLIDVVVIKEIISRITVLLAFQAWKRFRLLSDFPNDANMKDSLIARRLNVT